MSWLVVWFRDGKLYRGTVCRSQRTTTRCANKFNEYAQLYNRLHDREWENIIGVIRDVDLIDILDVHVGLPKRMPPEKLEAKKRLKRFMDLPARGGIQ